MASFVETNTRSFPVGGTALSRYARVKLSSGELVVADADDANWLGVVREYEPANSEAAAVHLRTAAGTVPMIASEAVTQGAEVFAAAAGKVATTGTVSLGYAMEAASGDGSIVEVLLT